MIILPPGVLADLVAHARAEAPVEACGLLAGAGARVQRSCRLTNLDGSPEHFRLDPREQFAAVRAARSEGLAILGVYHSHPATPARMSAEDVRLAFTPDFHYVILSLADPAGAVAKSFTVIDGRPVEEAVLHEEPET
ncbi:MAG: M67 family metallopeptidase [Armatimonadetes bacterium]|nr:M67 family metallopeptidase [Armatimonadota bacterium]